MKIKHALFSKQKYNWPTDHIFLPMPLPLALAKSSEHDGKWRPESWRVLGTTILRMHWPLESDFLKDKGHLTKVTQVALPAIGTEALEGVDPIDAGAAILTRTRETVVDVWGNRSECESETAENVMGSFCEAGLGRTFVAVGAGESALTGTSEVAGWLADAAAVGATHIGRDMPHPLLSRVGRHGNGATVNHWK